MESDLRFSAHKNLQSLKESLSRFSSLAVAFSGGVDSTFLLAVAEEVLGSNVLAVTVSSSFIPDRELDEAVSFCKARNIRHVILKEDILSDPSVAANPKNRCYLCKHLIFSDIIALAEKKGIFDIAEGSNADDLSDYRPGLAAIKELNVNSPLSDAGLTKEQIRLLSEEMKLPTFKKPSFACLASRFVYGETITAEKLSMVDRAEALLFSLGFSQFRVRIHGMMARIEILPEDFPRFLDEALRKTVYDSLTSYGFTYVSLDLKGYRTGSMNETINK